MQTIALSTLTVKQIRRLNALSYRLGYWTQIRATTLIKLNPAARLKVEAFRHQAVLIPDAKPNIRLMVLMPDGNFGGKVRPGLIDLPEDETVLEMLTATRH